MLLLENDVGGGGQLGNSFQNLATVLAGLSSYATAWGSVWIPPICGARASTSGQPEGVERTLAEAGEDPHTGRVFGHSSE